MKQTENLQLPILQNGDKYTKETQNEAFKKIDLHLGGLAKRVNDINELSNRINSISANVETILEVVQKTIKQNEM